MKERKSQTEAEMYKEVLGHELEVGDMIRFPNGSNLELAIVTELTGPDGRNEETPAYFNRTLTVQQFVNSELGSNKQPASKTVTLVNKTVIKVSSEDIENSDVYSEPGKAHIRERVYNVRATKTD